jgi:hypothetical protein
MSDVRRHDPNLVHALCKHTLVFCIDIPDDGKLRKLFKNVAERAQDADGSHYAPVVTDDGSSFMIVATPAGTRDTQTLSLPDESLFEFILLHAV